VRIIAGRFRGLALASVGKGDAGAHLRPTTDRIRESLFNILASRLDFEGLRVLDLFAGTGALGLEALSRGAAHVTFVDNGRTAQRLIRDNITKTRSKDQTRLIASSAAKLGPAPAVADLIFLDPPYGKGLGEAALANAKAQGWVSNESLIVWEEASPQSHPDFQTIESRKFGATHVTFLEPLSVEGIQDEA